MNYLLSLCCNDSVIHCSARYSVDMGAFGQDACRKDLPSLAELQQSNADVKARGVVFWLVSNFFHDPMV